MNIENMFDKPDVKQLVHAFSLLDDENDIQALRKIANLARRADIG